MKTKLISALVLAATPLLTHAVMAETIGVVGENGSYLKFATSAYYGVSMIRCQDMFDPEDKDSECNEGRDVTLSDEKFTASAKSIATEKRVLPGVTAAEYDLAAKMLSDEAKKTLAKLEKQLAWYTEYVPSNATAIAKIKQEKAQYDAVKSVQIDAIDANETVEAAAENYAAELHKLISSDQLHLRVPQKTANYVSRSHAVLTEMYLRGRRDDTITKLNDNTLSAGEYLTLMACTLSFDVNGRKYELTHETGGFTPKTIELAPKYKDGNVSTADIEEFSTLSGPKAVKLAEEQIKAGSCDDLKLPYDGK